MAKKETKTIFFGLCPICRKKLHEKHLTIINKSKGATLCCVKCVFCASSLLFTVTSMEHNMITTVGILTDIQAQDIAMLKSGAKIDYDDVLAMHAYLENYAQ